MSKITDSIIDKSNSEDRIRSKGHSYSDKKVSFQDSSDQDAQRGQRVFSIRDSIKRLSLYYESTNRVLGSNFAGMENEESNNNSQVEDDINHSAPFSKNEEPRNLSMNLSKFQYANQRGELGFWATLFTFIKVNIVAGFLFLPAGFKNGGWLFSVIAIFIITAIMIYCNISISDCTEAANSYSFSKIGYKAAGKFGYYIVEFGIAISQICFPCSYANLITQIVNNMINLWFGTNNNYYVYIAFGLGCILIPLCLIRNITKFASMHLIGDLAILATVITLAYESISIISQDKDFNYDNVKLINTGWAKLLGMSITSLEGIGVILPIKENMKDKKKFNYIIIIGTFFISLILAGFPLIMYLCYQDKVNEIVLNNLQLDKIYIQIVLGFLMFSVIIVYPVTLFPAFRILENMFCASSKGDKTRRLSAATVDDKALAEKDCKTVTMENLLRIFIVISTIAIGIFSINRFDTLLALVGCGICTPVALILPSVFHFLLYNDKQSKLRSVVDVTIAGLGCCLSITVLVFTLI